MIGPMAEIVTIDVSVEAEMGFIRKHQMREKGWIRGHGFQLCLRMDDSSAFVLLRNSLVPLQLVRVKLRLFENPPNRARRGHVLFFRNRTRASVWLFIEFFKNLLHLQFCSDPSEKR
jgi:hypothetical protein